MWCELNEVFNKGQSQCERTIASQCLIHAVCMQFPSLNITGEGGGGTKPRQRELSGRRATEQRTKEKRVIHRSEVVL